MPRSRDDRADRPPTDLELPRLDPEVTLLEPDPDVETALHALAVDHLLWTDGPAWWVDAGGRARTGPLRKLAPSRQQLDRIRIARGFTPHQHFTLVSTLADRLTDPGAVICPAFDVPYRDSDLGTDRAAQMLVRGVAALAGVARTFDVPVVCTRQESDDLSAPLDAAAARTLVCEATRFGPRFVGPDTDTRVYRAGDGWLQTTLAFWADLLTARAPASTDHASQEVTVHGAD